MKSLVVKIYVKEEYIEKFKEISFYNSKNSRKEPGNLRFDVLQSGEEPNLFFLYEVYKSDEAIAYHRSAAHYLKWRDTVADMMEKPREAVQGFPLCPSEESAYKNI